MTGDPAKVDVVVPLVQPARIRGPEYARYALHGRDYLAVVKIDIDNEQRANTCQITLVSVKRG